MPAPPAVRVVARCVHAYVAAASWGACTAHIPALTAIARVVPPRGIAFVVDHAARAAVQRVARRVHAHVVAAGGVLPATSVPTTAAVAFVICKVRAYPVAKRAPRFASCRCIDLRASIVPLAGVAAMASVGFVTGVVGGGWNPLGRNPVGPALDELRPLAARETEIDRCGQRKNSARLG